MSIPELIDSNVPDDIREFATWFCETYNIKGLCDPMYVCNVTAKEFGCGDGCGAFYTSKPRDVSAHWKRIVERLMFAYSTCIAASGRPSTHIAAAAAIFTQRRLRRLQCCTCGASCTGRQWWNRDTGWGICGECPKLWRENPRCHDDVEHSCGVAGIHWLPTEADAALYLPGK